MNGDIRRVQNAEHYAYQTIVSYHRVWLDNLLLIVRSDTMTFDQIE